ncbi:GDP-perosamine synthase [Durusdinium trenchii]|uniref:GDP-perosamine synthase n=1 Tax=Durusdinium trenchii TaxID=1381693 RepID=A0ABP0JGZ5_9DINO
MDLSTTAFAVNTPKFWGGEKELVADCIETGWISSEGPAVKEFESKMASRCSRRHAIACANGTAALDIAVKALNLSEGDEVRTAPNQRQSLEETRHYTMSYDVQEKRLVTHERESTCEHNIWEKEGRCDSSKLLHHLSDHPGDEHEGQKTTEETNTQTNTSEDATFNMDVSQLASKITPKTKAIICVHTYHFPVDMEPVLALAKEHGIKVIEDAAEMIGQTCLGRPCGSFGEISTMSFYPNKHITTGEGGMVLCDDPELAERCQQLRNLCFDPKKRRFVHEDLGWNYRMTNLQAALGLGQLLHLDEAVQRKREIGRLYSKLLKGCPGLILPPDDLRSETNIYWVYGVELLPSVPCEADEVMKHLAAAKVGTRPFFWPMHEQPVFLQMGLFKGQSFPVAERIARRGFYIPSGGETSHTRRAGCILGHCTAWLGCLDRRDHGAT